MPLRHEEEREPHADDHQGVVGDLEGDELDGERGPDVGAQDDPKGFGQADKTRVRETDEHHRRGARRLDDGRDAGPHQQGLQPVARHRAQDGPELWPRGELQPLPDQADTVEEHRQAAEKPKEHDGSHSAESYTLSSSLSVKKSRDSPPVRVARGV